MFIILILGAVVVSLAFMLERAFAPPMWVHMVLWFPIILGGSLGMLRPAKAIMVALQFKTRVNFDGDDDQVP